MLLYGLGIKSLAERLLCSEDEAKRIIEATFTAYPKLKEYIERQQNYPFSHNGLIKTFFGDKLKIQEYDLWKNAKSQGEARNLEARIKRLAVNLPIQGGTSETMSAGFFNALRQSLKDSSFKEKITTYIVVHDSSCSSLPVEKLFEIRPFLDKHYTEYCLGLANHICLLFDLLQGDDYDKAIPVNQKDRNTLEYKGSAVALLPIYDKIMGCKSYTVRCNLSRDQLVPKMVTSPMARFIDQKGTCISLDKSEYTLRFEKII